MGRPFGSPNIITPEIRESFLEVFAMHKGSEGLFKWSNESNENKKAFYLMCVKLAPKEIKTENINRTHEQFIELINAENKQLELTKGQPAGLLEVSAKSVENNDKVT